MAVQEQKISKHVGRFLDGSDLDIRLIKLTSAKPGKKIYIQAGMHGGEVTVWIIKRLYDYLKNHLDSGEVALVPIANPPAWYQRTYFSTNGKFDFYMGKDWNRNFPGSKNGSLGERMAHALFEEAKNYDFIIDLHTSRNSTPFGIVGAYRDLQYARISQIEYTFFLDFNNEEKLSKYRDSLLGQAASHQIPNITFECGSHDSYDENHTDMIADAILRILSYFDATSFSKKSKAKPMFYSKLKTYKAPDGGFVLFNKSIGESYEKGDVLYSLLNPSDLSKEEAIVAEEDGIVQKQSPTHIYWPGDDVLECLLTEDIREIPSEATL